MRWLPPIVCGSLVAALVCQVEAYWYPPWEGLGSCCGPISREDSLADMRPLPITAVPWYAEWCAVDLYGEYELGDECVFRADALVAEGVPAPGDPACCPQKLHETTVSWRSGKFDVTSEQTVPNPAAGPAS